MEDAFEHLRAMGEQAGAEELMRRQVDRAMHPEHPVREWMMRDRTPAEKAAHEGNMAEIRERDILAVRVLDPTVDFDEVMVRRIADAGRPPT